MVQRRNDAVVKAPGERERRHGGPSDRLHASINDRGANERRLVSSSLEDGDNRTPAVVRSVDANMAGSVTGRTARPGACATDEALSPIERAIVAALVSAIVKELQAAQPPLRQPTA